MMNKWKKRIKRFVPLIILSGCLLLVLTGVYSFLTRPVPIVSDVAQGVITDVCYRVGTELTPLTDYDEAALLSYLSTCLERRTFTRFEHYRLADVDLSMRIYTAPGQSKYLVLGRDSFIYGTGTRANQPRFRFDVLNADEVMATLFELLDLEPPEQPIENH